MSETQVQIVCHVEKVHEVINAFLRTCERGPWEMEGPASADGFEMQYRRGPGWRLSILGFKGGWQHPKFVLENMLLKGADGLPIRLKVVIRPSPHTLLLTLNFACPPADPVARVWSSSSRKWERTAEMTINQWLAQIATGEANGLADYLLEFYSLPERPEVTFRLAGQGYEVPRECVFASHSQ